MEEQTSHKHSNAGTWGGCIGFAVGVFVGYKLGMPSWATVLVGLVAAEVMSRIFNARR